NRGTASPCLHGLVRGREENKAGHRRVWGTRQSRFYFWLPSSGPPTQGRKHRVPCATAVTGLAWLPPQTQSRAPFGLPSPPAQVKNSN
uniref:Uncharacterized protein n=1 Tax=Aegilops tauschii subsp. strangulata TaxID=200361 RepID=A0A453FQI8_AEGTS